MTDRSYNQQINSLYLQPKNVGGFDKSRADVGSALIGKTQLGMVLSLQIQVQQDIIQDARFKVYGCGAAIATGSYTTELLKGKTLAEAMAIKSINISQALSLPPVKIYCAMMAEQAIKAAIENFRTKSS